MFDYVAEGQLSLFDFLDKDNKPINVQITKPVFLIEMFAGYGSQAMALKRVIGQHQMKHHFVCEFDKYAVASYNAVHGTHFDTTDIRDVHGEDLNIKDTDKYCFMFTYSFPCCPAGTKVKTIEGYKNIEDIVVGDVVNTHTNSYKKVAKKMQRISDHYYILKALGMPELKITENHPVYVLRDGETQWVKAKDLRMSDMVCFNVNTESKETKCDDDILWLLGRYAADGHINKYTYNSVNFAIANKKEEEFLNHIPDYMKGRFKRFQKSCVDYRIADADFQDLCMEIGVGSENKKVPQWILDLPVEKAKCFLDGYISGDGHIRADRNNHKITMFSTTSHELYLGIQQLVMKVYGVVCSCYVRKDGRKETFNDTYNCQFSETQVNAKRIGNQIFTKIRSVERFDEEIEVFNMEVETDNSYVCENIVVHNCTDISVAGAMKGFSKSDWEAGNSTRSGLLWEVERIFKEIVADGGELPQVLLMENVKNLISKFVKKDTGRSNYDEFMDWCNFLESIGYVNTFKVLNAKDYGIPQNRERVFMWSFLKKEFGEKPEYKFPEPIELKHCMADLLDDVVDEKYYINSDRAKKLIETLIEDGTLESRFLHDNQDGTVDTFTKDGEKKKTIQCARTE